MGDIYVPYIAANSPVKAGLLQGPLFGGYTGGRGVTTATVVVYLLLLGHRQRHPSDRFSDLELSVERLGGVAEIEPVSV